MAQTPQFKVYNPQGEYIAACKLADDAAALVALYGYGAVIRHGHSHIVWTEGRDTIGPGAGYDEVARVVYQRVDEFHIAALKRIGWSDEKIAFAMARYGSLT